MPDRSALRLTLGRIACGVGLAAGTVGGATTTPTLAQPVVAQAAGAQPVPGEAAALSDAQLLEDFCHYVLIANYEMAKASAQALIDRGVEPARLLGVVEDSATMQERFDRAYRRALLVPDLEPVAGALNKIYEEGRLGRARHPEQVAQNIQNLTGNPRAQLLGRQRLIAAGEYAVPQILEVLLARADQASQSQATSVLIAMGRQAVAPLCAALGGIDAPAQETVSRILGRIGYPQALPFLSEVAASTQSAAVRTSASDAIGTINASDWAGVAVSAQFRRLGEEYYEEPRSLTSFPGEEFQLVWSFRGEVGLQPTAVRTEVFHEVMAMDMAQRALRLDPSDQEAVALWLAANLKREIEQPEGYENPLYPPERRDATYYAVAAGPAAMQHVLGRALDGRDAPLARRAIAALAESAGSAGLTGGDGASLVRALSYPDRRVRFEAAMALGRANPRQAFDGSERVVPILAGTLRDADKRYGLVLSNDASRQQALRTLAEELGYSVLPPGSALSEVEGAVAEVIGVDLMLVDLPSETAAQTIEEARRTARLQATPIFALLSAPGLSQYGGQFESDRLTSLGREGLGDEAIRSSIEALVLRASGAPMSEGEAAAYAEQSLDILRDIALSGMGGSEGGAFDIADSAVPLVWALENVEGDTRLKVADVLSYVSQQRVQVALMDALMNTQGPERLALMQRVRDSAKRFGNLLEDRQVRWLLEEADKATGEEATQAAALIGALNLSGNKLVPLLVGSDRPKR